MGFAVDKVVEFKEPDFERLQARAEAGDTKAMVDLFEWGYPSRGRALKWIKRAAELGDPVALEDLGNYYAFEARPRRNVLAFETWQRAAEAGSGEAANLVGETLRDGEYDVPADLSAAARWFQRSAELGNSHGQLNYGYSLFEGAGVAEDPMAALAWYERAAASRRDAWDCEDARRSAMLNMGLMYEHGQGIAADLQKARYWYRRASLLGNVAAMHKFARLYSRDVPPRVRGGRARMWLQRAVDAGWTPALVELGVLCLLGEGVPSDPKRAAELFRRAAKEDDPEACYLLGRCYRDGTGVRRNGRVAASWFRRAGEEGAEAGEQSLQR